MYIIYKRTLSKISARASVHTLFPYWQWIPAKRLAHLSGCIDQQKSGKYSATIIWVTFLITNGAIMCHVYLPSLSFIIDCLPGNSRQTERRKHHHWSTVTSQCIKCAIKTKRGRDFQFTICFLCRHVRHEMWWNEWYFRPRFSTCKAILCNLC